MRLQLAGYDVRQASDGAEAVAFSRDWHPDGIVLDLRMPVMGGLEALPRLRADSPTVAVVVFSAEPTESAAEEVLAAGADAFVTKGAPMECLDAALAQVLVS